MRATTPTTEYKPSLVQTSAVGTSAIDTSSDMVVNRPKPVPYVEVTISTTGGRSNVPAAESSQYKEITPHRVNKNVRPGFHMVVKCCTTKGIAHG